MLKKIKLYAILISLLLILIAFGFVFFTFILPHAIKIYFALKIIGIIIGAIFLIGYIAFLLYISSR